MPCFDFKCPACGHEVKDKVLLSSSPVTVCCSKCQCPMSKQFPTSVHTLIDSVVDSCDRGKVVKEKNERLKKMHAGYNHEQRALRRNIEEKTAAKLKGN